MRQSGCLNCKERYLGCHSNCLKYKQYKEELERVKELKEQMKKQYSKFKRKRSY